LKIFHWCLAQNLSFLNFEEARKRDEIADGSRSEETERHISDGGAGKRPSKDGRCFRVLQPLGESTASAFRGTKPTNRNAS
jgi:hypothetical protein